MSNDNASLGKASLWTSIGGIVLPVCLAVVVAAFLQPFTARETALFAVFSLILELVAFGCGIAARRTVTGKAGLVISAIILLSATLLFIIFRPK